MKVSVIGTGYVGLVSGACLAEKGHSVQCVDMDADKVRKINNGESPIFERSLDDLLVRNVNRNLHATVDLTMAVNSTDISLIAVGTPFDGREIDLRYVTEVARQIGTVLKDKKSYHVVVVKSTVVPGTTDEVVLPILEESSGKKAGVDFGVGMNPEFLREGEAIEDFMFPDRIVLGGIDDRTVNALAELYNSFPDVDKVVTNNRTAEMIKYTSNSLLATMISFSNEIGNLCAAVGSVDVKEVMRGVHLDKRLSPILPNGERIVPSFTTYIEAGCGFGGSCFPKDVKALIAHGLKKGRPMQLLEAVIQINERQPQEVLSLLKKHFPSFSGVRLAILGLAFKPETDDMRESPAIPVVRALLAEGARINAYDPAANDEASKIFGNSAIDYCDNLDTAVKGVEAVLLLTSWKEFNRLPELLGKLNPQPLLIDGRRMLDRHSVRRYDGIGL
jgi:UDPglucose 6-dehydrogenase